LSKKSRIACGVAAVALTVASLLAVRVAWLAEPSSLPTSVHVFAILGIYGFAVAFWSWLVAASNEFGLMVAALKDDRNVPKSRGGMRAIWAGAAVGVAGSVVSSLTLLAASPAEAVVALLPAAFILATASMICKGLDGSRERMLEHVRATSRALSRTTPHVSLAKMPRAEFQSWFERTARLYAEQAKANARGAGVRSAHGAAEVLSGLLPRRLSTAGSCFLDVVEGDGNKAGTIWATTKRSEGKTVATVRCVELAPERRGRGLGKAAILAFVEYARDSLDAAEVRLDVTGHDPRDWNVTRALGGSPPRGAMILPTGKGMREAVLTLFYFPMGGGAMGREPQVVGFDKDDGVYINVGMAPSRIDACVLVMRRSKWADRTVVRTLTLEGRKAADHEVGNLVSCRVNEWGNCLGSRKVRIAPR
jgi:GNAT superfamily N-acetyltransferase